MELSNAPPSPPYTQNLEPDESIRIFADYFFTSFLKYLPIYLCLK
jgi:hypothetical protein